MTLNRRRKNSKKAYFPAVCASEKKVDLFVWSTPSANMCFAMNAWIPTDFFVLNLEGKSHRPVIDRPACMSILFDQTSHTDFMAYVLLVLCYHAIDHDYETCPWLYTLTFSLSGSFSPISLLAYWKSVLLADIMWAVLLQWCLKTLRDSDLFPRTFMLNLYSPTYNDHALRCLFYRGVMYRLVWLPLFEWEIVEVVDLRFSSSN